MKTALTDKFIPDHGQADYLQENLKVWQFFVNL